MADFITTGTISVTNGDATVTGSGTAFVTDAVRAGDVIWITPDSGHPDSYPIDSVTSATALELAIPYKGATDTGLSYVVMRRFDQELATNTYNRLNDAVASFESSASISQAGVLFALDASTTMAAPADGRLRLNNSTIASVTGIAISDISAESGAPNVAAWIVAMDDASATVKGTLIVKKAGSPQVFAIFKVTGLTDNSGWSQLAVTHDASNGVFTAGDEFRLEFYRSGDNGADGDFQADGSQPMTGNLDMGGNDIADAGDIVAGTATIGALTATAINGRAPGPVSIAAINANSGTSAFLTGVPGWATMVVLDLHRVSLSDASSIFVRLGDSGGPEDSGYVGGAGLIFGSAASHSNATGGALIVVNGAAREVSATVLISKVEGNRWNISGVSYFVDGVNSTAQFLHATKELSGVLDRVGIVVNGAGVFDGSGRISGKYW